MKNFNEEIEIQTVEMGECDKEDIGNKLYEELFEAIKNMFYFSEDSADIKVCDLFCSQSYVKEHLPNNNKIKYMGIDDATKEKDGTKLVPDIQCSLNKIPVNDNTFDFIFTPANRFGYGENHRSIFEVERIIKPQGYLIVAMSKFWWLKQFNQFLLCYRGWRLEKAVEIKYVLEKEDENIETAKYFLIYKFNK